MGRIIFGEIAADGTESIELVPDVTGHQIARDIGAAKRAHGIPSLEKMNFRKMYTGFSTYCSSLLPRAERLFVPGYD
jgi:hypothetical protein